MRRLLVLTCLSTLVLLSVSLCSAAQGPINARISPPPPDPQIEIELPPVAPRRAPFLHPALLPAAPATVSLLPGTRIDVVLDTPLSTRISKSGQPVTFRTSRPIEFDGRLELPPETAFTGRVVRVKRPGVFASPGELRVKVERIELSAGESAPVVARLDTPDTQQGRIRADRSRGADIYNVGLWALNGTLAGAQIGGGKGAAIGAGAGAAVALIILMAKRGPDVYLEPGTPFLVILDEAVQLSGAAVQAAQESHARAYGLDSLSAERDEDLYARGTSAPASDPDRPALKRRPRSR